MKPLVVRKPRTARELLPLRLVCTAISALLVAMGGYNIVTREYYGRSTRFGFHEVWLEGAMAVSMGTVLLLFGLVPLAVWFRKPGNAAAWATVWTLVAAAWFVKVVYGQR